MNDNLLLNNQLCFALYSATNSITRMYTDHLGDIGLTYPQYLTMVVLWEQDNLTVGEIGNRLHLNSGTLTPLLKRLESAGWVERNRDAVDERVVRVTLSDKGRQIEQEVSEVQKQVACQTGLSESEFDVLKATLHRLTRSIGEREEQFHNVA